MPRRLRDTSRAERQGGQGSPLQRVRYLGELQVRSLGSTGGLATRVQSFAPSRSSNRHSALSSVSSLLPPIDPLLLQLPAFLFLSNFYRHASVCPGANGAAPAARVWAEGAAPDWDKLMHHGNNLAEEADAAAAMLSFFSAAALPAPLPAPTPSFHHNGAM